MRMLTNDKPTTPATPESIYTQRLLRVVCGLMVFSFPITVLVADEIGSAIFFILAILGLIALFFPVVRQPLTRDAKFIFFAVVLFVGVALLSYLLVDSSPISAKKYGRYLRFLLVIPIYYLLRFARIPQQAFWYGITLGAIVAGLTAIYQTLWQHGILWPSWRAKGSINPIIFGNLSLLMAVISLAAITTFWKKNHWLVALPALAAALGLIASVLSSSRGGWIALPAFGILFFWFWRKFITPWQLGSIGFVIVILASTIYITPHFDVHNRVTKASQEMNDYFQTHLVTTSIGERLEMWKASWIIFTNHPVFGVGPGGYFEEKQSLIDSGRLAPSIAPYTHPHNEYFAALAFRGVIGFLTLLLLYLIPGRVFFDYIGTNQQDKSLLGLCGLITVVAFAHFSLTGDTFDRSLSITFLTFLLAVVPALAPSEQHDRARRTSCI